MNDERLGGEGGRSRICDHNFNQKINIKTTEKVSKSTRTLIKDTQPNSAFRKIIN